MSEFVQFMFARLSEPSTWRGIVALATALGVTISPEAQAAIVSAGLSVIGLVGVFFKDPGSAE